VYLSIVHYPSVFSECTLAYIPYIWIHDPMLALGGRQKAQYMVDEGR